ncbi:phytoene desaturase family protein [Antribacter gilvus]|uniref:phytoene desaturase family protein n=1 Tax=Antribacter gilvus TaxID=2304675 RepID=UPI000F7B4232|nr:NAD(P)/FAD-dependent oxidoreductase [Antribacter gilvus]
MSGPDVVVVGAGPNGLAAAVTLARSGLAVTVLEEQTTAGGGARTLGLGLAPGIVHDVCSAVHAMAWASPFFRAFDLEAHGVELLTPRVSYGQPIEGARAAVAYHDLATTVAALGPDGGAWEGLLGPVVRGWRAVADAGMGDPAGLAGRVPDLVRTGGIRPLVALALRVLEQGTPAWGLRFRGDEAPALLSGVAAHAISRVPSLPSAAVALLLAALAHACAGWAVPRGGSQAIVDALLADLAAHGGVVVTGHPVQSAADLPPARGYVFDTTPRVVAQVLGDRLPTRVRRRLTGFRHGPGAAKVDFVLAGPVPWAAPGLREAGTVHLGGTRGEIAAAEAAVVAGRHVARPVCLVSDPAVTDPTREAGGLRPLWSYAHVPAGSTADVTEAVTAQIERFAPGFRDVVVASRCVPAARMADHDSNLVGGDILGGALGLGRIITGPAGLHPYGVGVPGVVLCSSSTPPGPGVHGAGGYNAALHLLRTRFGAEGVVPFT